MNEFTLLPQNHQEALATRRKSPSLLRKRVVVEERRPLQKRRERNEIELSVSNHAEVHSITNISSRPSSRVRVRYPTKGSLTTCSLGFHCFARHHPFRRHKAFYISRCIICFSLFTSCSALVVLLLCCCSENATLSPIASSALGTSVSFHSRRLLTS